MMMIATRDNLPIREDPIKGVWIAGASDVYVGSEEEVWSLIRQGQKSRAVAATRTPPRRLWPLFLFTLGGSLTRRVRCTGMNEGSSRSHSLFQVTIQQKNNKDMSTKTGKLFLVDLAGSEKVRFPPHMAWFGCVCRDWSWAPVLGRWFTRGSFADRVCLRNEWTHRWAKRKRRACS